MIARFKDFFDRFIEPGTAAGSGNGQAVAIATAALLLEMMRMDDELKNEEREAIMQTLQVQFGLDPEQVESLIALAEQEAREAGDYYRFTSLINTHFDSARKVQIIENLWHVAMIDGHLNAHELHLMRKLADLLHVGHADYVAAKQRARQSAGLPA